MWLTRTRLSKDKPCEYTVLVFSWPPVTTQLARVTQTINLPEQVMRAFFARLAIAHGYLLSMPNAPRMSGGYGGQVCLDPVDIRSIRSLTGAERSTASGFSIRGGWEQARLRTSDERSRGKAPDEVSAAIPGDASRREQVILKFPDNSTHHGNLQGSIQ
jgi:hypothetical protein